MKNYLDLIPLYAKAHRRQSRLTRLCILLAVFLVSAIFGMADMYMRCMRLQAIQTDGAWHAAFRGISVQDEAILRSRPEVKEAARYATLNYRLDQEYEIAGIRTVICGMDEKFLSFFPSVRIEEGRFPSQKGEILLTKSVKKRLGLAVGDPLEMSTPQGKLDFIVTGFTGDTSMLTVSDAFGAFVGMETWTDCFAEGADPADMDLYVQFFPFCRIQRTIAELTAQLPTVQIGQNTKLLGLMFQTNDLYMMRIYATAAILSILVVISGILMISGSLNSNVARRTEFFGLLRCLGATEKQVRRFVRREALHWCRTAIPAGLFLSVLMVWGLCALLRYLTPTYFSEIPALGISWIGILSGSLLGLLTVLFAAHSPAEKASKVSPLTAAAGNAGTLFAVRRAANLKLFPVEIALGIHHAAGSKKNFFLLSASFAFSIILFLSFQPTLDFARHALTVLQPYSPDFSIIRPDNTWAVPKELSETLLKNPSVRRVYGRSFAYEMTVTAGGQPCSIDLISYEENQFGWAKDLMTEGSVAPVRNGQGLLTVFSPDNPLSTGDVLALGFAGSETELPVSGVLSKCPFDASEGAQIVICSEEVFEQITGLSGYTILDLQLDRNAPEEDVDAIRQAAGAQVRFSDHRLENAESRAVYYVFFLFLYGFLAVIALISFFNIINAISMSVSARLQQYAAMRAIGADDAELVKMVAAEALTYLGGGILSGCLLGFPLHFQIYDLLVASRWGDAWIFPLDSLLFILALMGLAALFAVLEPARRICRLSASRILNFQ